MTFNEITERLKLVNAGAKLKHGSWCDLPAEDQFDAIGREIGEWHAAHIKGDVHGPHGEIAELIDVANCCFRRIMALSGEHDA